MKRRRSTVALAVYSIIGGPLLGLAIAALSLAGPLDAQVHKTPDYASGYAFFVVIVCVLAGLYGLLAGAIHFGVALFAILATRSRSYRTTAIAVTLAGAVVSFAGSAGAMWFFGSAAMPWWLVAVVTALDIAGLLVIMRVIEGPWLGDLKVHPTSGAV